jgi:hypothetical protein
MLPKRLAGLLMKTQNPLELIRFGQSVHNENPSCRNGRTTVARTNGNSPFFFDFRFGKLLHQTGLGPNSVAIGTPPLRPIITRHQCLHEKGGYESDAKLPHSVLIRTHLQFAPFSIHLIYPTMHE